MGLVQYFIFLCLFLVWIKRIRTQEEFKIALCNCCDGNHLHRQIIFSSHLDFRQTWRMEFLCENSHHPKTVSARKLQNRPPTGFRLRIWLEVLQIQVVGELKLHGICNRMLVYKKVVEVRSNYKKSYFWWCWLLRLNSEAWEEHLTSQNLWAAAWVLATCGSPVYLVVHELRPCVLWPLIIGLMVVLLRLFWYGEYGFTYRELKL